MVCNGLCVLSNIIGWAYFACWSLSFYPQVWTNFRRKSVIGLSFDFLLYNVTGYICYSTYNAALLWNENVLHEYREKHPQDPQTPIAIQDVAFALHGLLLTVVTIIQCFVYERGNQKLSKVCVVLVSLMWASIIILTILAGVHTVAWLFYIYWFSYVKLTITLIKYVPQAYMNFRDKSTVGWSIGNVLLDFSGGVLSFLQMFLDSWNAGNYDIFTANPVKLGLSFISIFFDILFIIQHYALYRHSSSNARSESSYKALDDHT